MSCINFGVDNWQQKNTKPVEELQAIWGGNTLTKNRFIVLAIRFIGIDLTHKFIIIFVGFMKCLVATK